MNFKIYNTFFKCPHIFFGKVIFEYAAIIFKSLDSSNKDNTGRGESGKPAFDIEEFFSAEIRAESCFGDAVVAEFKSKFSRSDGIASVSNIGKRTAVRTDSISPLLPK